MRGYSCSSFLVKAILFKKNWQILEKCGNRTHHLAIIQECAAITRLPKTVDIRNSYLRGQKIEQHTTSTNKRAFTLLHTSVSILVQFSIQSKELVECIHPHASKLFLYFFMSFSFNNYKVHNFLTS